MALAIFTDRTRAAAARLEIGNVCSLLIVDADQRGRKACYFRVLGHDQRHWLTAEADLIAVEWAVWRTRWRHLIAVFFIRCGHFRPMGVRKDVEHTRDRQCFRGMDLSDTASGDRRADDKAECQS